MAVLNCSKAINPAPGEDPCAADLLTDMTISPFRVLKTGSTDPCNDPTATRGCEPGQGTEGTISVITLAFSNLGSKKLDCAQQAKLTQIYLAYSFLQKVEVNLRHHHSDLDLK